MKLAASVSLAALALAACATTQPAPAPVAVAEGAPPAALPADGLPHPLTVEGAASTSAPRRMLSLRAVSKSSPWTAAYFAAWLAYWTPFSVPIVPK